MQSYSSKAKRSKIQTAVILLFLIVASTTTAWAMQVNNLEEGESAAGLSFGDKTKSYYIESKIGEAFTLGFQGSDWKNGYDVTNLYGQFTLNGSENRRGILGTKHLDSSSRAYLGIIAQKELSSEWVSYTLGAIGRGFQELQVGVNYQINDRNYLNVSYLFLNHKGGRNDLDIGVTYKF